MQKSERVTDEMVERAKTAWSSISDEHNGWDALSQEERDTYVSLTAALSSAEEKAVDTAPCAHVIGLTRYEPITNCSEPDMAEHPNGDWVRLDDVCKGLRANPIEWDGDQAEFYGMHEFGYYLIIRRPSGFSLSTFTNKGGMRPMGFHKALDDAETEAQADYQRRILSCLNPSPQPREQSRSALVDVPAVESEPVACPCTLIEQDEDCPVGYPSLLCGICGGRGHTTREQVTALACEMIKIASDVGEPSDPFAAWESISLIQSQNDQLLNVADQALQAMNRCEHDGGFDREIGPIGCYLGDKCVCLGIYPILSPAALSTRKSSAGDGAARTAKGSSDAQ